MSTDHLPRAASCATHTLQTMHAQSLAEAHFLEHGTEPEHDYVLEPATARQIEAAVHLALETVAGRVITERLAAEHSRERATELLADALAWDPDPIELQRADVLEELESLRSAHPILRRLSDTSASTLSTRDETGAAIFILE